MGGLFEITGWGTIVLAWVLAALVLGGVTHFWPRLAHGRLVAVAQRLLAQLLVTVMLVAAIGVTANRYGLWFVSWRDLGSVLTGPNARSLGEHGADPRAAAAADLGAWGPADAPVTTSPPPTKDPLTALHTYTVTGPTSGYTGVVHVRMPQGPQDDSPVIEVFHGYPVSAQSAFTNLALDHIGRELPDAIVIVPDWSPGEVDTECVDGPAAKMETWLTVDVPAWAARTLGATADRGSWATLGYSAGGWCATMAAMKHPQTYAAGISLGGYTRPLFSSHYKPFAPAGGAYDMPLLAQQDPPEVALLTQFSPKDHYAAPSTQDLVAATSPPLSVTEWHTPDAGHRVGAWKPMIPDALRWLRDTAPGFAA